jgi:cysteine-rich repeat protein
MDVSDSGFGSVDALVPGKSLGGTSGDRFLLEEQVGRGGQAVVFQALDTKLERKVAVKISTAPPGLQRQIFIDRFEREMRLTSRVHHPHVLQLYDCGELEDGTPYVLLEWMPFGALDSLVHRSRSEKVHIPLDWVHYYASAVAAGLRATHAVEIIHRDIKPDNILIGRGGVAKLMDFGIARDDSMVGPSLTETGQTLGTLGFMAPEHLAARPVPQSDLFGLGVTIYTLLTGRLPVQSKSQGIPNGVILDPAWELVPASFIPLLKKLTAPQLEDRFAGCEEVLDALADLEVGEDTRIHFPSEVLPPLPSRAFVSGMTAAFGAEASGSPAEEGGGTTGGVGSTRGFVSEGSTRSPGPVSGPDVLAPTQQQRASGQVQTPSRSRSRGPSAHGLIRAAILVGLVGLGFGTFQWVAAPCGNGLKALSEACDDGNRDNTDACLTTCQPASCGDGFARVDQPEGELGFEGCDDGNQVQHDTCTNQCVRNAVFMHGSGPEGPVWWQGSKEAFGRSERHLGYSEKYEMPATPVLIGPFWILKNEVTQAAYAAFLKDTGTEPPKGKWAPQEKADHPVGAMGWMNAVAYCAWLGGNLPSEVQWEYAARSGGEDINYPWGNEEPTSDLAILGDHRYSKGQSWPVCSKPAGNTAQGLCDMAGNVWEYVADGYSTYLGIPSDPEGKPYWDDPRLPSEDGLITLRGGGFWQTDQFWLRTRARAPYEGPPSTQHGFRCAWGGGGPPY